MQTSLPVESTAPGLEPPAPVITQFELKLLRMFFRASADSLARLQTNLQSAAVEPGPLRLDPVALRMRVPRLVLDENEAHAMPCPPMDSKPDESEFTGERETVITQKNLSTLRAIERFAVDFRQGIAAYVQAGLPLEPGPLSLDTAVVQEPIFASVIATPERPAPRKTANAKAKKPTKPGRKKVLK